MRIAYGSCSGSIGKLSRYVTPRVGDAELTALFGQTSIARAYNRILASYVGLNERPALVLLHDDLEILDSDAEAMILRTFESDPDVWLIGVIGTKTKPASLAWWNGELVGKQYVDGSTVGVVGAEPHGEVEAVEGSFLALSPQAVEQLRFDEKYDGFHGYDVDFATQVRYRQRKVVVLDIATHHHSTLGFKSPEIEASWHTADGRYRMKWGL